MGMIWTAYRMDETQAQSLAQDLAVEDEAAFEVLESLEQDEDTAPPRVLDVDQSWHAIDRLYAAAGATSPISTGRVPASDDVVVGCCDGARVKAIVAGMGRITPALLRRGYDAKRFAREGIYPDIWDEEDALATYVMPYDAELREFYQAAADAGEAIVWHLD